VDLIIILLNWNAAADTLRCLREISAWQALRPTVIVVDNASTDDSLARIAAEAAHVHLVCNETNLGFAGGNNRGLEAALALGEVPILLLNNDATISEADIATLLQVLAQRSEIGLIGPLLYDGQDKNRLLAAGSKDPSKHHHSHNHSLVNDDPVQIVECVPGTAIIGKAAVFRQAGLLDEAYFFSGEVADLCLRARQDGWLSAISHEARVYHTLERSSDFRSSLYPYYIIRNRFLLTRKFHQQLKIFFFAFWTLYSLALSLKVQATGQTSLAKAVRLGLIDGLQGRFGNQNERVLAKTAPSL